MIYYGVHRCILQLRCISNQVIKSAVELQSGSFKNYSVISKKREFLVQKLPIIFIRSRYDKKSDGGSAKNNYESDDESEEVDDIDKKATVTLTVQSLRADLILKTAIGIARNKIETAFYENKIRINGKKINKKSASCGIGDEIDLIKNDSPVNPAHIVIARVEILSAVPRKDLEGIKVTMKRFRNLTIEKYDN